jgi:hypothetical protein
MIRLQCVRHATIGLLALAWCWIDLPEASAADPIPLRWVYAQTNLQVTDNADELEKVLRRAHAAGYNGVLLADYKLNVLDRVTDNYFRNARRIRDLCRQLKLDLVPAIGSFGYSAGILAHDPNLAEGLPVRNMPMTVRDGAAVLASPDENLIPGDFEEFRGHQFRGWGFQDAAGEGTFVDEEIRHNGKASLRIENPPNVTGNRRVSKLLPVRPFGQYHASVWIRAEQFETAGAVRMFAIGKDGRVLAYNHLKVQQDQDWTQHHVIFNSLDSSEVTFYIGVWEAKRGKLWIDEARVTEAPFVNLVRRSDCPLIVTNEDGTQTYTEGRDFAPLHDPKLGNVPYAGEFEVYHTPPMLTIPSGSRIREGQSLKVSYYHAVVIYDGQVCCSLSAPKTLEIFADQVRRVDELLAPQTWMLSHDEIRVANWSADDERSGLSAGELLASNVRKCIEIIRKQRPNAQICIWSDMFDPHHNARNNYYLVRGDFAGSWEGLPPDVTIINWNSGAAKDSLAFFGQRGHSQVLAGYYDGAPEAIEDWIATARPADRVQGVMYTTWQGNYSHLEAFAKSADQAWSQRRRR